MDQICPPEPLEHAENAPRLEYLFSTASKFEEDFPEVSFENENWFIEIYSALYKLEQGLCICDDSSFFCAFFYNDCYCYLFQIFVWFDMSRITCSLQSLQYFKQLSDGAFKILLFH